MASRPAPAEVVDAARAYDEYAVRYDELLRENRINAYMRRVMTGILLSTYRAPCRLLELGCGTGDEALALADQGCEVVASDPSSRMVEIARAKARNHSNARLLSFLVGRARDIGVLLAGESQASFDGAYSSFSLSYEPDLDGVRQALRRLVRPGGRLVLASMNRVCGTECLLSIVSGRPWVAGRRLKHSTVHKVGRVGTVIFSRTPSEVARAFQPGFTLERVRALPAVIPPHYTNRLLVRWSAILDALERIDPWVGSLPGVRWVGDHAVITMRRAD